MKTQVLVPTPLDGGGESGLCFGNALRVPVIVGCDKRKRPMSLHISSCPNSSTFCKEDVSLVGWVKERQRHGPTLAVKIRKTKLEIRNQFVWNFLLRILNLIRISSLGFRIFPRSWWVRVAVAP